MAPLTRRALLQDERKQLEEKVSTPGDADLNDLYLMELKQPNREIRKCGKTWVAEEEDHSGNVEDDEVQILGSVFLFHNILLKFLHPFY